jgi:hypothetical protein
MRLASYVPGELIPLPLSGSIPELPHVAKVGCYRWIGRPFRRATGFDPPALTLLRNSNATRCTEPERVVDERPAMRAAAGSERWQQEQTRLGRLVVHAVEAGRA